MATNPFDDVQAHEALMVELQNAVDECHKTTAAAREALEELIAHNTDILSHPDMRQILEKVDAANIDNVDERIQQHDENPNAHAVIMESIKAQLEDVSKVRELIDQLLAAHNTSDLSHPDIREFMAEVRVQLGSGNLADINEAIETLHDYVHTDVYNNIIALQTVDAQHDAAIAAHGRDIVNLDNTVNVLEKDFQNLTTSGFVHTDDLAKVQADINLIKLAANMGLVQHDPDGPNMVGFTDTFPEFVYRNDNFAFSVNGATCKNGNDKATYAVTAMSDNVTVSPTSGILDNQTITVTVKPSVKGGDQVYLVLTATDPGTSKTAQAIVGASVTMPVDASSVTLRNLPMNIEPGTVLDTSIKNIYDNGSGRFTYSIDPGTSGLIFSKDSDITIEDQFTMTVPTGARRNVDLTFTIVIHDKFNENASHICTVHTNSAPGADNFKTNIPTVVVPNKSYTIKFSGITSAEGVAATYAISNADSNLTFSKEEDILANENITMTVGKNAPRGDEIEFTVVATDINGNTVSVPQGVRINQLPSATAVSVDLPAETVGGVNIPMHITGGLDAEGSSNITYNINAGTSGLAFSKTSGITPSDVVYVTVPKVAEDVIRNFTINVVDSEGEAAVSPKNLSLKIKPVYVANAPYITSPQEGSDVWYDFRMSWSEFSATVDMSQTTAMQIASYMAAR